MFIDYLNHTCNIYHLVDTSVNSGYGIHTGTVKTTEAEPSEKEVPCHFHNRSNSVKVVQKDPYSAVDGEVKLSLPVGTDIRENDTVEDCRNGIRFRASVPKEIYGGHHLIVTLFREKGTGAAI